MFHQIDFNQWPRAQMFYYFSQMAPTGYSLTVEVDITHLLDTVHKNGVKFFPAYLWLVTRNLNRQVEFKCAMKDEKLGYYDTLTPLYASWHEDTNTFSLMWTEYCQNFREFEYRYMENQTKYGENKGILCQTEKPPENAYTVSALPWVDFSHFAVHSYENKPYFFPSVEAGKYHRKNGRLVMPLSLTCHHATTDGYHIAEFLKSLQEDMNQFEDFL